MVLFLSGLTLLRRQSPEARCSQQVFPALCVKHPVMCPQWLSLSLTHTSLEYGMSSKQVPTHTLSSSALQPVV